MERILEKTISLPELVSIIKKHLWGVGLVAIMFLLLSGTFLLFNTSTYTAKVTILVEPLQSLSNYHDINRLPQDISNEIQFLTNTTTIRNALEMLDLSSYRNKDGSDYSKVLKDSDIEKLIDSLTISIINGLNTVEIRFSSKNKQFSLDFLNSLIQAFDTEVMNIFTSRVMDSKKSLLVQMDNATTNLKNGIQLLEHFSETNKDLQSINIETFQTVLAYIHLLKESVPSIASSDETKTVLETVGSGSSDIELQISNYKKIYREYLFEKLSRIIVLQNLPADVNSIHSQESKLLSEMELAKTQLLNQLIKVIPEFEKSGMHRNLVTNIEYNILKNEEIKYISLLKKLPIYEQEKTKILKEVDMTSSIVFETSAKLDILNSYLSTEKSFIRILESPKILTSKEISKFLMILTIGMILGVVFGSIVAIIAELSSGVISDEIGCTRVVGADIPILGIIPANGEKRDQGLSFVMPNALSSSVRKAYDRLAGIIASGRISNINIFCFSSSGYGEDNTNTVINLAYSMVQSGKRVVIIGANNDEKMYCDIKSQITLNPDSSQSISFYEIDENYSPLPSNNGSSLSLITFNMTASELSLALHSEKLHAYIENLSTMHDMVLIDAPTYNTPSDQFAAAQIANGLVITLCLGVALKKEVKEMIEGLSFLQIPVTGLVLTKVPNKVLRAKRRRFLNK